MHNKLIPGIIQTILLAGLLLTACKQKEVPKPVLSDDKLARIMADLSVAEGATNGLTEYMKDSLKNIYIQQVFDMHGTTFEVYESDLRIIAGDLNHMEQIVHLADELLMEKSREGAGVK